MIKDLQFGINGLKRARVWLGELPPVHYKIGQILERTMRTDIATCLITKHVAVEFLHIAGPRTRYGLLGATYTPNNSGVLIIKLASSENKMHQLEHDTKYLESISAKLDDVRIGLPNSFSAPILDKLALTAETHRLHSGLLHVDHAAYGCIGSSDSVFAQIASSLIPLLLTSLLDVPDQDIISLLEP